MWALAVKAADRAVASRTRARASNATWFLSCSPQWRGLRLAVEARGSVGRVTVEFSSGPPGARGFRGRRLVHLDHPRSLFTQSSDRLPGRREARVNLFNANFLFGTRMGHVEPGAVADATAHPELPGGRSWGWCCPPRQQLSGRKRQKAGRLARPHVEQASGRLCPVPEMGLRLASSQTPNVSATGRRCGTFAPLASPRRRGLLHRSAHSAGAVRCTTRFIPPAPTPPAAQRRVAPSR